jgi:hypothetical protein
MTRPVSRFCFANDRGATADYLSGIYGPPKGMTCRIFAFNPSERGTFRMSFEYIDTEHAVRGKMSEHADVFQGQFVELVPGALSNELNSTPKILHFRER